MSGLVCRSAPAPRTPADASLGIRTAQDEARLQDHKHPPDPIQDGAGGRARPI